MDIYVYDYSTAEIKGDFFVTSIEALKSYSSTQFVLQNTAGIFNDQLVYLGNFVTNSGGVSSGTISELKIESGSGALEIDIKGIDVSISNGSFNTGGLYTSGAVYHEASANSVLEGLGNDTFYTGNGTRVFPGGGVNSVSGSGTGAGVYFTGSFAAYQIGKATDGNLAVLDSNLSRNGYTEISGNYMLKFEGDQTIVQYDNGVLTLTSTAAAAAGYAASSLSMLVAVTDSAANVEANLGALQKLAAAGELSSISLTDSGTPLVTVTAGQLSADSGALQDIQGSYQLAVTGMTVQAATGVLASDITSISVTDSANNVFASLSGLENLAEAGKLSAISLTDKNTPTLTLSAAQDLADAVALGKIAGGFGLDIAAGAAGTTIKGVSGVANTVIFSGNAFEYGLESSGDGGDLSVTDIGTGAVFHLIGVQALQFTDNEVLVAANPGSNGTVTTGNMAELYGAVFGREPDVSGLAFYQAYLAKNPATPLQQYAQWFLSSTEYTGNSAHNYAQTVAGDQQFIADSYQNLLHRTPTSGEVSFYENNVIAKALQGLQAGTAAYTAADLAAHAQTLVYFSASAEFLSDVQVTATNPSSAQHWLVLV